MRRITESTKKKIVRFICLAGFSTIKIIIQVEDSGGEEGTQFSH